MIIYGLKAILFDISELIYITKNLYKKVIYMTEFWDNIL